MSHFYTHIFIENNHHIYILKIMSLSQNHILFNTRDTRGGSMELQLLPPHEPDALFDFHTYMNCAVCGGAETCIGDGWHTN
jgi:hypothetical protein